MKNIPEPDMIAIKHLDREEYMWFDRAGFKPYEPPIARGVVGDGPIVESTYQPSGKFITRSDGKVAEIFELASLSFGL